MGREPIGLREKCCRLADTVVTHISPRQLKFIYSSFSVLYATVPLEVETMDDMDCLWYQYHVNINVTGLKKQLPTSFPFNGRCFSCNSDLYQTTSGEVT